MTRLKSCLGAWLLFVGYPVFAADDADWTARLERVEVMRATATSRQDAADAAFEAQRRACQEKFLVNSCINKAQTAYLAVSRENRAQRLEADALEREVKREQAQARTQRAEAEAAKRAAELSERERNVAAEREQAEAERARNEAKKQEKAASNLSRKAEREAAQQRKQAEHAARIAERKAKAERRQANN